MIESLGIDEAKLIIFHEGGRAEEFRKCIFPSCHLFHSTRLDKCPALGLSFAEEEKRREDQREKEQRASRAEEDYRRRHLEGAENKWRGWLGWCGVILIPVLAWCGLYNFWAFPAGVGWAWFWFSRQSNLDRKARTQAREIYDRVLKGGYLDSNTIGAYLRRT